MVSQSDRQVIANKLEKNKSVGWNGLLHYYLNDSNCVDVEKSYYILYYSFYLKSYQINHKTFVSHLLNQLRWILKLVYRLVTVHDKTLCNFYISNMYGHILHNIPEIVLENLTPFFLRFHLLLVNNCPKKNQNLDDFLKIPHYYLKTTSDIL